VAQSLQITSPVDGTILSPGQTVTITINADPSAFAAIVLSCDPLLECPAPLTAAPYQFTLNIPSDIPAGRYGVAAAGYPASDMRSAGQVDGVIGAMEFRLGEIAEIHAARGR
jgi:hypothetical protein